MACDIISYQMKCDGNAYNTMLEFANKYKFQFCFYFKFSLILAEFYQKYGNIHICETIFYFLINIKNRKNLSARAYSI